VARNDDSSARELTYPLGAASRLTGLSPELLRAWERRHGVVAPLRSAGGTRRYRASDLERLRLLKAAVDAGHRIGQVAGLDLEALRRYGREASALAGAPAPDVVAGMLDALHDLDEAEARRLLALQLSALGPVRFARDVATPLLVEIGELWVRDEIAIAAEHLATSLVRNLLGSSLQPTAASLRGPRIVFATPEGERHEIGLQMAALVALGAGANPLYLGLELPSDEWVAAAVRSEAAAVAVSVVTLTPATALPAIRSLRKGLPRRVQVWVGGHGAPALRLPDGVECITDLAHFEHAVALLGLGPARS